MVVSRRLECGRVVANHAVMIEAVLRVIRIGGREKVDRMTTIAVGRGTIESRWVASAAVKRPVCAG